MDEVPVAPSFGRGLAMPDRIEREIEDILRKIDNFVPERTRRSARRAGQPIASAHGWLVRRLSRVSLNQVMMWALILIVASVFFRGIPGVQWILIGSLIVLVTAFLLSLRSGRGARISGSAKRWRGQPIDLSGPSLPNRIKGWLKGRKKS